MLARGHALVCTSFEVSSHGAAEYRTPQLIPTKIDRHRCSHAVPTGLSLYLSSLPTPFAQLCRFMSSGWGGEGRRVDAYVFGYDRQSLMLAIIIVDGRPSPSTRTQLQIA